MRIVWITSGILCVGLGVIGVFLPLLPTVPFLLLAAFCFGRSSERLHAWLVSHPKFGASIADWQQHGAIRKRPKLYATASIVAVFLVSFAVNVRPTILMIQIAVLVGVLAFIWTRPEGPN